MYRSYTAEFFPRFLFEISLIILLLICYMKTFPDSIHLVVVYIYKFQYYFLLPEPKWIHKLDKGWANWLGMLLWFYLVYIKKITIFGLNINPQLLKQRLEEWETSILTQNSIGYSHCHKFELCCLELNIFLL